MPAGDSARDEARRQLALADAHTAAAQEARAAAGRFGVADVTERATARALAPLAAVGYHLLADRRWPGSRRAQVDLVVVGPGGVFVVDTKAWREVGIAGGRIHRGQEDVTDDLMSLAGLGDTLEAALADVGLAPGEVHTVVVLAGRASVNESIGTLRVVGEKDVLRYIASFGQRLTPTQVDIVLGAAIELLPEVNAPAPISVTIPEPALPRDEHPIQEALLSEDEVQSALLDGMLASPIEDWMSFLHPSQARLVRRSFNGPARIRGAAGTGKTVVALHRAAYLARSGGAGRILVTTYVRTLPDVLRNTLARMAPEAVERVDFLGVHEFAGRVLDERGIRVRLDGKRIDEAFTSAWNDVGQPSVLGTSSHNHHYWKDEIAHVIKGRGLSSFEQYAALTRAGRRYRLTTEQRRAVWDLRIAYDERLRAAGVHDWADQILLAERELERRPMDRYGAVVIDEAQDLSAVMVRMLYGLVGDRDDGFMLVGDGQQSIYPGGYTLAEIGVDIAGRGVVLDTNYRNTKQIIDFAFGMVAGDEYADIEGLVGSGELPGRIDREGVQPTVVRCGSWRQRQHHMVNHVRSVLQTVGTVPGDVGVLCLTRHGVRTFATALREAGLPVIELTEYDGRSVNGVKVGTIKRAKGLEFKQVLLPDIRRDAVEANPPQDGAERERWTLLRRELYVGMTRARDGLWVALD